MIALQAVQVGQHQPPPVGLLRALHASPWPPWAGADPAAMAMARLVTLGTAWWAVQAKLKCPVASKVKMSGVSSTCLVSFWVSRRAVVLA